MDVSKRFSVSECGWGERPRKVAQIVKIHQVNLINKNIKDRITCLKSSLRVTEKCTYCLDYSILPQDMVSKAKRRRTH